MLLAGEWFPVYYLARDYRHLDVGGQNLFRRDCHNILREDRQVCPLARLDCSLRLFFECAIGSPLCEASRSLRTPHSLLRIPTVLRIARFIAPGPRRVEAPERIHPFDREIRAPNDDRPAHHWGLGFPGRRGESSLGLLRGGDPER